MKKMQGLFMIALSTAIFIAGCSGAGTNTETTAVTGVAIADKSTTRVDVKGTLQLSATVTPEGATDKTVTWTSSDADKATVTVNGLVTGVAAGSVTITVKSNADAQYSDSLSITVVLPIVETVFVEGGTFRMGSTDRTVSSFYMAKTELTQGQWKAVMEDGNNPSHWKGDDLPVEKVTWYKAVEFCNKLSVKEGLEEVYTINGKSVTADFDKNGWRLPTEAEWEYAARGGKESKSYKYSGSNTAGDVGWYKDNSDGKTHPVGEKEANELGLYDMSGNVFEWCWDWYGAYSSESQPDPKGPSSGSDRVLRGGSWRSNDWSLSSANRNYFSPSNSAVNLGFRPVRRT